MHTYLIPRLERDDCPCNLNHGPREKLFSALPFVNDSKFEPCDNLNGAPERYPNQWTPIPANGETCLTTGLGHSRLYRMLSPGGSASEHVRVANITEPGAKRGKTLFHVGDMLRFLDQLAEQRRETENSETEATPCE